MFLYEVPVHLVTEYWVGGVVGLDPVKKNPVSESFNVRVWFKMYVHCVHFTEFQS